MLCSSLLLLYSYRVLDLSHADPMPHRQGDSILTALIQDLPQLHELDISHTDLVSEPFSYFPPYVHGQLHQNDGIQRLRKVM